MDKRLIDLIFELKSGCLAKEENIREKLDLSPAEFRGILALLPDAVLTGNILSGRMGLTPSRGSRVIEKMMKNGYIKSVKKKGDRRISYVKLTEKGISTREQISKMLDDCEQIIAKKIGKSEKGAVYESLVKITEILIKN